jgi:hypothetical protein
MRTPRPLPLLLPLALLAACDDGPTQGTPAVPVPRMLVLTTEPLLEAAQRYGDLRAGLGFTVTVDTVTAEDGDRAAGVQARIRTFVAAQDDTRRLFVLLIGDADSSLPDDPERIPVAAGPLGSVGDGPHADLDGDGLADLAIGRLPFRAAAEVDAYRERVSAHEAGYAPGPWNKRIPAFAGQGGFGDLADAFIEMFAAKIFEEISADFDVTMTYAAPSSPWFLPPALWEADYAAQYNAGSVLQPYIGHTLGAVPEDRFTVPTRRTVLAFLSCSDGEFQVPSTPYASLGETLLLRPDGPVAAVAATDVSHPYANAVLARELSLAVFNAREPTYGEALTTARRGMVEHQDELRLELDAYAESFVDEPLPDLVASHVVMYNLLGDPALSPGLPPARVVFDDGLAYLMKGETVTVSGGVAAGPLGCQAMVDGEVEITLETSRGAIRGALLPADETDPATCTANHATANDKVVVRVTAPVVDGRFSVSLAVPSSMPKVGYYLKGYATDGALDAVGSLYVVPVP